METIINICRNLQFIFKPSYWLMNNRYSKGWDKQLNYLLDNNNFTDITGYTAKLGKTEIWICNHPYASMTCYDRGGPRPSRLTIKKAHNKLCKTYETN